MPLSEYVARLPDSPDSEPETGSRAANEREQQAGLAAARERWNKVGRPAVRRLFLVPGVTALIGLAPVAAGASLASLNLF